MKAALPISALTRKSLADVTRRKGRTILVVLGILIGVFGLTAINVADGEIAAAFAFTASQTATPDIAFRVKSVAPSFAATLRAQPNVKAAQIETNYVTRWQVSQAPGHVNITIVGRDSYNSGQLNPFQLTDGRMPGNGEIVLESSDRALQSFNLGDTITVESAHGPTPLKVVGLARTPGATSASFSGSARGYMSSGGLDQLAGLTQPNEILLQVNDIHQQDATTKALTHLLKADHITIQGISEFSGGFRLGVAGNIFTIMRVLSVIALLLTGFLIVNTVTTLVAEQTKIIGTMKAVGGTRGVVIRGYLTSVLIYGVIGSALGIALGIWGGNAFAGYLATIITLDLGPFQIDPGILLVSALVGLGIPLAAAMLPLWNGTRITVREAMAAYGVSGGGNGGKLRTRRSARLLWVPQTTWLGLRGLFRKRGRAILTLLALTLSATAFLAIQTTTYSVNTTLTHLFDTYNTDVFVSTQGGSYTKLRTLIQSVPNVGRVERWQQDGVTTQWGNMILEGVEPDTQEYHYDLIAGRWFSGDDLNTILISDVVAQKTGLHVGDEFTVNGVTTTAHWRIIGEVHDLNGNLGGIGTSVITIATMNSFNGQPPDEAGAFFVQGIDRSQAAVDTMATRLDETLSRAGLNPTVSTAQQNKIRNQNQFQILYYLLYAVAAIVALVGILGLFNTLTTSVLERRREIGILRSMGATGWNVASVFWTEGLALALISWVIAAIIGIPAAYGFVQFISNELITEEFAFNPLTLLVVLVFILVSATLASVIPAVSAARVRVVETLRYE